MKSLKKLYKSAVILCPALALVFSSCIGVSADISIKPDGSGSIALEYRVSQMLESMGRLDGNERWPAIPVGRADFERSLEKIPGLKLSSFSVKDTPNASGGRDLVTKALVKFSNTAALLSFLDSTGSRASLSSVNGKNTLRLVLMEAPAPVANLDLQSLLREISAGYGISIKFSASKSADLAVLPFPVPAAEIVSQGKVVSFSIGLAQLLEIGDGLSLEISW